MALTNSTHCGDVKVVHISAASVSLRYLLLDQLQFLQHAGYQIIGVSSDGPDAPFLREAGIEHFAIPISRTISPLRDLVSLWRLWRFMRRHHQLAIVHTHTPKAGLLGQIAARLAGVPIVVNTLHGFYFHENMPRSKQRFFIALETIAARCSHVILSQSKEDIDTALDERICKPVKIKYLGNGINLELFCPDRFNEQERIQQRAALAMPENALVVGFVGRLAAKRKGFSDFLSAAQRIAEKLPETRFLIVGDYDHGKPDAVRPSAALEYGISDRCHFVGMVPNSELPLLYSIMDVLVLPSLFEGVPRAIMEASAMGVPCVATNVKGNREAVIPNENGLLVPLGDVASLEETIRQLLTNHTLAERLSVGGRRIAKERFDEQKVFQKVKDEYSYWLKKKGLSPR